MKEFFKESGYLYVFEREIYCNFSGIPRPCKNSTDQESPEHLF